MVEELSQVLAIPLSLKAIVLGTLIPWMVLLSLGLIGAPMYILIHAIANAHVQGCR